MKLLACISGGALSEALLRYLHKQGHAVTAFWADVGGRSPAELCKSLGVALIQMDMKYFAKALEEPDRAPYFPARNMVILSMAISYAAAHGYGGLAVGFCTEHDYPDAQATFQSLMDALSEVATGKKLIVVKPFVTWSRADVEKLRKKKTKKKAKKVTTKKEPYIPRDEVEQVQPMHAPAPPPAPPPDGTLRPFIFSAETAYGYVNDKPSFDEVANKFGSVKGVLEARMDAPYSDTGGAPTFKPEGQGVSLAEWLGPAINTLVDTNMMTLGAAPGHNPGHQGCC